MLLSLGLRLYLADRSPCISPDGVKYIEAARAIRGADWRHALSSFYPPGYPAAIAAIYPLVGDWERSGVMVSVICSLLLLVPLGSLLRAGGASPLVVAATLIGAALCPYPARYSVTVRSEALYSLLFLGAVRFAACRQAGGGRASLLASGGLIGLSYLVRPEGLGLLAALGAPLALEMRRPARSWSASLRELVWLTVAALVIAGPYVACLRIDTGRWILSRKSPNVISMGIREATGRGNVIPQDKSTQVGLLEVLQSSRGLLLEKLEIDSVRTFAAFFECIHFAYLPFLLAGIAVAGTSRFRFNSLLHWVVWFYLAFFAVVFVNRRFYAAIVPLAMIWCGLGFEFIWHWLKRQGRARVAYAMLGVTLALILGKGLRVSTSSAYLRSFGSRIAERSGPQATVTARDPRVAFYATARQVRVNFPIDPSELKLLMDGGSEWLVAVDGDLTAAAEQMLASNAKNRLEMELPAGQGKKARLYRLRLGRSGRQ